MSLIPGTTIEYETKKHGEITSAYTYNSFFTAWNNYTLDDSSANTLCRWSSPTQTINLQESTNSSYVDLVWLYGDAAALDKVISVADDENDTLNVITKLDIQKYKLVIDGFYIVHASDAGVTSNTEYKTAGYQLQENEYIRDYVTHWEAKDDPTDRTALTIPVLRYTVNDKIWYFEIPDMFPVQMNNDPRNNRLKSDLQDVVCITGDNVALGRAPMNALGTWTYPSLGKSFIVDENDDFTFIFSNPSEQRNVVFIALNSIEAMLKSVALLGVYFEYDSTMYLGFMDSTGQTTGEYLTADKWNTSAQYQSENINNYSEHTPPYVPPYSDEDNDDPLSSVGAPFGTGLAHYYVSTVDGAALTQISEAMSTWDIDATKKDLYRNLISCKIVKPPTAVPATPGVFEIYGVKPQYNGADITINEVTGNPDISFGPYSIDRKFNDFRDRAPYSRAEIFLPYCGWCVLPSHVIGRSVSVAYYSDIIAGTVKAVVYCGTNPVAEASGVMSVDIPFAAQNVGEKVAAANIGMLAYGRAAIQTAAGIGTAVASKGKSGWGNILSGGTALTSAYNQLSQVENGNYTEICGKSGDGCALAGVDTIVIKITRPLYGGNTTAPYVPAGFAHTVGFVSMKQSKVNACTGLIVCDNVEVSGISGATDAERAEIKRVLETGLYVNSPPE